MSQYRSPHKTGRRRPGDIDASYSSEAGSNFATQTAPLSISNLVRLRDKFNELVDKLQEETLARKQLERQLVDEQCFRTELVQAQAAQQAKTAGQSDSRATQLAKVVSNLRFKLRESEQKISQLELSLRVADRTKHRNNASKAAEKSSRNGEQETAALAFHNQRLKTEIAGLEAQLRMAKMVADEKVEEAEHQQQRFAILEQKLDDVTLDNDKLMEKSKSLLGKYRKALAKSSELKGKLSEANARADKAESKTASLSPRMATLRRQNQSLKRTIAEGQLEIQQRKKSHEHSEKKYQEVHSTCNSVLATLLSLPPSHVSVLLFIQTRCLRKSTRS